MDRNINSQLVSRCIGFHGPPLQKIWEGERGEKDLQKLGVGNPDFTAYKTRQKYFSFQDRAKRLKLHQFIAKKANVLFGTNIINEYFLPSESKEIENGKCYVTFISLESRKQHTFFFCCSNISKSFLYVRQFSVSFSI